MTHESSDALQSKTSMRIILFPLPFQGHINPMLQLANILHTRGFNITVIHAEYNYPNPSNYSHFTFIPIKDRFSAIADQLHTNADTTYFVKYLNESCVDPFRDCLAELLAEPSEERVVCVITDAGFHFAQGVADDLKLPRLVLRTSSLGGLLACKVLPFYSKKASFHLTEEDGYKKYLEEEGDEVLDDHEVEIYLRDATERREETFDVLLWWKANNIKFPILSEIAKHVLGMPISTVASETAFSTGGRVIDKYRSSLTPKTAEGLICAQDWLRSTPTDLQDLYVHGEQLEVLVEALEKIEIDCETGNKTTNDIEDDENENEDEDEDWE